jgi:hypothetical protein
MDYPLFYNSVNGDRVYDADSFSDWLKKFFTTGVFKDELRVTAASGMTVNISAGYANINGKVMEFDASSLTLDPAEAHLHRIDAVVIERNDTSRNFTLKIVKGNPNVNSAVTAPALVRNTAVYQIMLAKIRVNAGATYISQAHITDTRADASLCGYVAGTVTQMDFTQFSAQFQAYYDAFISGNQTAFETWFAGLQDILDEDTAGHLQNEIDNCVKQDSALISNIQQAIANAVSKAGDVMTGSLQVAEKMRVTNGSAADGQLSGTADGDFGVYDNLHNKWVAHTDSDGATHVPVTATSIYFTKKACTEVNTAYAYTAVSALADWSIVAVRFTVYETVQILFFVRGISGASTLVDNPSAGRFRGSITVDWTNNRIGIRCLNAGSGNTRYDLVYFDRVYGVL